MKPILHAGEQGRIDCAAGRESEGNLRSLLRDADEREFSFGWIEYEKIGSQDSRLWRCKCTECAFDSYAGGLSSLGVGQLHQQYKRTVCRKLYQFCGGTVSGN